MWTKFEYKSITIVIVRYISSRTTTWSSPNNHSCTHESQFDVDIGYTKIRNQAHSSTEGWITEKDKNCVLFEAFLVDHGPHGEYCTSFLMQTKTHIV